MGIGAIIQEQLTACHVKELLHVLWLNPLLA
jgi:hypothetical protein